MLNRFLICHVRYLPCLVRGPFLSVRTRYARVCAATRLRSDRESRAPHNYPAFSRHHSPGTCPTGAVDGVGFPPLARRTSARHWRNHRAPVPAPLPSEPCWSSRPSFRHARVPVSGRHLRFARFLRETLDLKIHSIFAFNVHNAHAHLTKAVAAEAQRQNATSSKALRPRGVMACPRPGEGRISVN